MTSKQTYFIKKNFIFFLIITFIQLLLYVTGTVRFETNDDMAIISIINGEYGQTPNPNGKFISPILANFLFILNSIHSGIPWYSLFLYIVQVISCMLAFNLICSLVKNKSNQFILIIVFLILYSYLFLRLNFASTSLFLWFTVMLQIGYLSLMRRKPTYIDLILGLLLSVSYLIRPSILYIGVIFTLPLFLTMLVSKSYKRAILVSVPFFLMFTLNGVIQSTINSDINEVAFQELNSARSQFQDTSLSDWGENTPTALEKVGWTKGEYELADIWFMHDENIYNEYSINTFLEANNAEKTAIFSFDYFKSSIKKSFLYLLVSIIGMLLIVSIKVKKTYHFIEQFPRISGYIPLMGTLYIFAGIIGISSIRMPLRMAVPLAIFLFLSMVMYRPFFRNREWGILGQTKLSYNGSLKLLKREFTYNKVETVSNYYIVNILLIISCLLIFTYTFKSMDHLPSSKAYTDKSINRIMDLNGDDTIFINFSPHTVTQYVDPFKEFMDMPDFLKLPGGWMIQTPAYYNYLNNLGIEKGSDLIPFMVDNEKTVLYFWQSETRKYKEYSQIFDEFINENYGHLFPDRTLKLEVYIDHTYDQRDTQKGLVYSKIISVDKQK